MAIARPEICAICDKPAIGFHYDVPSCSGCRSFFRRTIKYQKEYKCMKDGNCMQLKPAISRLNCQACRLEKCIEVGMNPNALQTKENYDTTNELARKIMLRQANRNNTRTISPIEKMMTMECRIQELIDRLVVQNEAHDRIRRSKFSPTPADMLTMAQLFERPPILGCQFEEMSPESPPENIPPPAIMNGRWKWWPLADSVYSLEHLKTFPFFNELDIDDKRYLGSHISPTSIHLTRSYYSCTQRSEVTINPDGMRQNPPWKTMDDLNFDTEIITAIYRLGVTPEEIALLKAMLCSDPAAEGLSGHARSILDKHQKAYVKAFFSLVMAKRGKIEGPSFFASALLLLSSLRKITDVKMIEHRQMYDLYRNTPYACAILEEILFKKIL